MKIITSIFLVGMFFSAMAFADKTFTCLKVSCTAFEPSGGHMAQDSCDAITGPFTFIATDIFGKSNHGWLANEATMVIGGSVSDDGKFKALCNTAQRPFSRKPHGYEFWVEDDGIIQAFIPIDTSKHGTLIWGTNTGLISYAQIELMCTIN